MTSVRRTSALVAGPLLAVVLATTVAAGPAAAPQARGTFVDASGASVGWLRLTEDRRGDVHVNVHVKGLAAGLHGIHIHAVGSCSPTFAAAGGHYNPLGHQHGLENPSGPHAGDLPNLIVNAEGVGHLDARTDRVTLSEGGATLVRCRRQRVHHPRQPGRPGHRRRQRRQRRPDRVRGRRRRLTDGVS